MDECEKAFQELKHYLSNPPLLSPFKEGENLYLYLVVLTTTISATLIREEDRRQLSIYYVNQVFQGAEAKIPSYREDCIHFDSSFTQVAPLLLG